MSVNIFGSSGQFSHSNVKFNNRYVDQKFTTLSTNLTSKVNKAGDTISGDLKILINDDPLRTFGVSDIGTGKSMSLLLGNLDNQIRHNFGHPLKIAAAYGTKFTCPGGETCRLGVQNDARARFLKDVIMNNNYITGLHDPVNDQDATTKIYIDTKCVKNNVGYIPNLITNDRSKVGFLVTASSEFELNVAWTIFSIIGEWLSAVNTNFWIQVQCPERVRIHKFALRGVTTGTMKIWKLLASNDAITWEKLYDNVVDGNGRYIDQNLFIWNTDSLIKYCTYRILVTNADGEHPGLSYWQLYTVDEILTN